MNPKNPEELTPTTPPEEIETSHAALPEWRAPTIMRIKITTETMAASGGPIPDGAPVSGQFP